MKGDMSGGSHARNDSAVEQHRSLPRFNNSFHMPQMNMTQKAGAVSPRGHQGTLRLGELFCDEHTPCTLEDIERFHKQIYYSTRTADDKVQYLSILICAQPHLDKNTSEGSNEKQDISDA